MVKIHWCLSSNALHQVNISYFTMQDGGRMFSAAYPSSPSLAGRVDLYWDFRPGTKLIEYTTVELLGSPWFLTFGTLGCSNYIAY